MATDNNFVERISEILLRRNTLTCEEMNVLKREFKDSSNTKFEEFLIEEGLIPKSDVLNALSEYYQVPAIDVMGIFFDHHLVSMFPAELMKREGFIPYETDGEILYVIASNPSNQELIETIGDYVSYNTVLLVGIKRDIRDAIEEFHSLAPTEVDLDYDRNDRNRSEFEEDSVINVDKDPHD